jgi:hypothetical protein
MLLRKFSAGWIAHFGLVPNKHRECSPSEIETNGKIAIFRVKSNYIFNGSLISIKFWRDVVGLSPRYYKLGERERENELGDIDNSIGFTFLGLFFHKEGRCD